MKPEEIAGRLASLGLGEDEAAVYVQLWRMGPSKAAEVAQVLRHSRPRTYRALDSLAHNGFLTLGAGRPRLYSAAPPAALFDALRVRAQNLAAALRQAEADIVPELGRVGASPAKKGKTVRFTLVRGMDALVNQAQAVYSEAQHDIHLLFTHPRGRELFRAVDHQALLAQRARQNVSVRLLVGRSAEPMAAWAAAEELPDVGIRSLDTDVLSTVILVDRREALVVVAADPEGRERPELAVAFRTDAADFVAMQGLMFDRLWESATPWQESKPGKVTPNAQKGASAPNAPKSSRESRS